MIFLTSTLIPGIPLQSFTTALHKFFKQAFIVSGFPLFIAAMMNASTIVNDFQHYLMSRLRPAPITDPMWPDTKWIYVALTNQTMPQSSGWNNEVGFGGKNTTSTFSSSWQTDSGWPGALSVINRTLNSTLYLSNIFTLLRWSIGGIIHKKSLLLMLSDCVVSKQAGNFCFSFLVPMGSSLHILCLALSYVLQYCHIVPQWICLSPLSPFHVLWK